MSYDLTIRSDDLYSLLKKHTDIYNLISALPSAHPVSQHQVLLGGPKENICIEVDMEHVNEDGDLLEMQGDSERNCVRLHIPAAFFDGKNPDMWEIVFCIAEHLGWKVYDEQKGSYLTRETLRGLLT
jgi:hypothetical protein